MEVVSAIATRALEIISHSADDPLALGLPPVPFASTAAPDASGHSAGDASGLDGSGVHSHTAAASPAETGGTPSG